jgi:hypothetical protein
MGGAALLLPEPEPTAGVLFGAALPEELPGDGLAEGPPSGGNFSCVLGGDLLLSPVSLGAFGGFCKIHGNNGLWDGAVRHDLKLGI